MACAAPNPSSNILGEKTRKYFVLSYYLVWYPQWSFRGLYCFQHVKAVWRFTALFHCISLYITFTLDISLYICQHIVNYLRNWDQLHEVWNLVRLQKAHYFGRPVKCRKHCQIPWCICMDDIDSRRRLGQVAQSGLFLENTGWLGLILKREIEKNAVICFFNRKSLEKLSTLG